MNLLLWFNHEFQKNVWQDITLGRLLAMPVVLGLLTVLSDAIWGRTPAAGSVVVLAAIMTMVWGTRAAADSVGEEVTGRTWDLHRLGARGATALVLGKFFGSTLYIWYGVAVATGIFAYLMRNWDLSRVVNVAVPGLMAEASSFFLALVLKNTFSSRRWHGFTAWAGGLIMLLALVMTVSTPDSLPQSVIWYGHVFGQTQATNLLELALTAWLLIGSVRLVRRDLGFHDGPAGWGLFTLFAAALVYGTYNHENTSVAIDNWYQTKERMLPFLAALLAAYAALLAGEGGPGRWARLSMRRFQGRWLAVWRYLPPWVTGAAASAGVGAALMTIHPEYLPFFIACLGTFCRDALVVTVVRFRFEFRAAVIVVGYFLLMWVAGPHFDLPAPWPALFRPLEVSDWLGAAIPWVEVLLFYVLFQGILMRTLNPAGRMVLNDRIA